MKVTKKENQVFIEQDFPTLDTTSFIRLKGNPYGDTEKGIIRIYKGGSDSEDKYITIQFRKVVGASTHLNSVMLGLKEIKEAIEYLWPEQEEKPRYQLGEYTSEDLMRGYTDEEEAEQKGDYVG